MKKISILIKKIFIILSFVCLLFLNNTLIYAEEINEVYLGGYPVGLSFNTKGGYVSGICDVLTDEGIKSPAKESGIKIGDYILSIDNKIVNNAEDIENIIKNDETKNITINRFGIVYKTNITPVKDMSGKYRIGVYIKENICGIGTMTFTTKNSFASLGHPVLDDNGLLLNIKGGNIFSCNITGYVKGERGLPGELKGIFNKTENLGQIKTNLVSGVYGKISKNNTINKGDKIEIGDAKIGKASFLTTIDGENPQNYSIMIVKIDDEIRECKNYVIKITDERLLDLTGGILQGMSGSPIIQDNKLVGAVTHVFVNDPTRGFAISIDNMLKNI